MSRRIGALPRGFEAGKTWVLLAHRKAIQGVNDDGEIVMCPGIIHAFKPDAVEYVVTGHETADALEALVKRGITPIHVSRVVEQAELTF